MVPAIRESREGTKDALDALKKLFVVYPQTTGERDDARDRGAIMLHVLGDLPAWAIVEAVDRWLRGAAGSKHDYRWMPAPAVLRAIAMELLWPHREDAKRLKQLLAASDERDAEPVEGERERVIAGFQELKENLDAVGAEERKARKLRAEVFSAESNRRLFESECDHHGMPKDSGVSPSLGQLVKEFLRSGVGGASISHETLSTEINVE